MVAQTGYRDAIGLDIGGHRTAISIVQNHKPVLSRQSHQGPVALEIPAVVFSPAMIGGLSPIAVSPAGAIQLGQSAAESHRADDGEHTTTDHPGATLLDAHRVLGYMPASVANAGETLRQSEIAIGAIAQFMGADPQSTAEGIVELAGEILLSRLRSAAAAQARSLKDYALVAYGGAGPLLGNIVTRRAQITPLIIPANPASLAARGLLTAPVRHQCTFEISNDQGLVNLDPDMLQRLCDSLGTQIRQQLSEAGAETHLHELQFALALGFEQQQRQLFVDLDPAQLRSTAALKSLDEQFRQRYCSRFGAAPQTNVVASQLRVTGVAVALSDPTTWVSSNREQQFCEHRTGAGQPSNRLLCRQVCRHACI